MPVPHTVNAEILDRIIAHAVDLEGYKTYEVRQLVSFLNSVIEPELVAQIQKYAGREMTLRRLMALRQAVKEILVAGYQQLGRDFTDDMHELAALESQWNVRAWAAALPVSLSFVAPSTAALREMIRQAPVEGRFVKEWLTDLAPETLARVNQQIMIGVTTGESIDEIVRRIAGTRASQYRDGILNRSRRDIDLLVRTSVSGVSNNVRQLTYRLNRNVVTGWMFVATLDLRTCTVCAGLDGERYDIDTGPMPPAHGRCRCTTTPVLASWQELGLDLAEAPESTRASLDGQVPDRVKFPAWLARRSAADQDRVLGPTRGRMYRRGAIRFADFASAEDRTRLLTLEELRN
jgi:SPP1 gp7 family putative phage head morphogenesis protein